jgi:hypothetical protein
MVRGEPDCALAGKDIPGLIPGMSAAEIIKQFKALPPNERAEDAELANAIPPRPLHATSPPMPTLSKFYGIRISVRTSELNHPLPHFHARYAEFEASIALDPLQVLAGTLPRRAMDLTLLWAGQHRAELLAGDP